MTVATMLSGHAHRLLEARGPFGSVYLDDSHDAPDAATQLEVKWRDIERELTEQGATQALVSVLEQAVLNARPPVGRSGHGLIATADGVLVNEHLVVSPPNLLVRVSDLPFVLPLVEYGPFSSSYMVVAIDHLGAELTVHHGSAVRTATVEGGGHPVHKVAGADTYGWGDQQHRVEEAIRKNVRAVADALADSCDRDTPDVIFLVGQDRVRAELMSALPERVRALVVRPGVGARNTGVDETVRQAIALEFQNRRLAAVDDVATRVRAEAGRQSGLVVEGLTAVCAALRENAVATLILGDLANETVLAGDDPTVLATDPDALSAFGVPPTRMLRADEAVPFAAMAHGASLVHAGEHLSPMDGVAALLRYAAAVPLVEEQL